VDFYDCPELGREVREDMDRDLPALLSRLRELLGFQGPSEPNNMGARALLHLDPGAAGSLAGPGASEASLRELRSVLHRCQNCLRSLGALKVCSLLSLLEGEASRVLAEITLEQMWEERRRRKEGLPEASKGFWRSFLDARRDLREPFSSPSPPCSYYPAESERAEYWAWARAKLPLVLETLRLTLEEMERLPFLLEEA
jgi:hypothetical protein